MTSDTTREALAEAAKNLLSSDMTWGEVDEARDLIDALATAAQAQSEPLTEERLWELHRKAHVPFTRPEQQTNRWTGEEETVYVPTMIDSPLMFARLIEREHGIFKKKDT